MICLQAIFKFALQTNWKISIIKTVENQTGFLNA